MNVMITISLEHWNLTYMQLQQQFHYEMLDIDSECITKKSVQNRIQSQCTDTHCSEKKFGFPRWPTDCYQIWDHPSSNWSENRWHDLWPIGAASHVCHIRLCIIQNSDISFGPQDVHRCIYSHLNWKPMISTAAQRSCHDRYQDKIFDKAQTKNPNANHTHLNTVVH